MKKKYKIPLIVIVLLIIIIVIGIIILKFKGGSSEVSNVKVVDSIDNFSYTLDERDTKLMKNNYNELKKVLKEDEIDYTKYAEYIAKLFIIDLYTIDNKLNKYDVGSIEYVYPDSKDNFRTNVENTIYRSIENNSDGKRSQKLPIVKSIETGEITKGEYLLGEESHESYIVPLSWEYESDLGYDKSGVATLIEVDSKLYIVEYKAGDLDE